jgi:hypothetical protein
MNRVAIVSLNWNGLGYLQDCLASLQAQTCTGWQVIVVDNGSTDGVGQAHELGRVVQPDDVDGVAGVQGLARQVHEYGRRLLNR